MVFTLKNVQKDFEEEKEIRKKTEPSVEDIKERVLEELSKRESYLKQSKGEEDEISWDRIKL